MLILFGREHPNPTIIKSAIGCGKKFIVLLPQKSSFSAVFGVWNFPQKFTNRTGMIYDVDFGDNDIDRVESMPKLPVQNLSFKKNRIWSISPGRDCLRKRFHNTIWNCNAISG